MGLSGDAIPINGDVVLYSRAADKEAEMGKILERLSEESSAQIDVKQRQLKKQLAEIKDNRAQRLFQQAAQEMPNGKVAYQSAVRGPQGQKGKEKPRWTGTDAGSDSYTAAKPSVIAPTETAEGESMEWKGEKAAVDQVQPYVATGTYSLPVTLPRGRVRLDFARPMGDAELSILAVPTGMFPTLYTSLAILAAMVILLGGIKIWPQSAKRSPISVRRAIIYIVLFVALTVGLGLLGILISLLVIFAIEARRGFFTGRTKPAAKNSEPIAGS
jgi:small basic protein